VSIEFLAPAKTGDLLTAVAQERWLGKRTGLYDLVVTRTDGTVIAHARGRSHRLRSAPSTTES
jgi:acyl-CoA thioesterase